MACLEHECSSCGTLFHNNSQSDPCPVCGGYDYSTVFDEVPDYDEYDYGDAYDDDLDADEDWS